MRGCICLTLQRTKGNRAKQSRKEKPTIDSCLVQQLEFQTERFKTKPALINKFNLSLRLEPQWLSISQLGVSTVSLFPQPAVPELWQERFSTYRPDYMMTQQHYTVYICVCMCVLSVGGREGVPSQTATVEQRRVLSRCRCGRNSQQAEDEILAV